MDLNESILRALANQRRLQILDWLKDPVSHFPRQVDGDLVKDGVCGVLLAAKLRGDAADRERTPQNPGGGRPDPRQTD